MQSVAYTFLYIRCEALYYLNGENAWGSKLFDTPSYVLGSLYRSERVFVGRDRSRRSTTVLVMFKTIVVLWRFATIFFIVEKSENNPSAVVTPSGIRIRRYLANNRAVVGDLAYLQRRFHTIVYDFITHITRIRTMTRTIYDSNRLIMTTTRICHENTLRPTNVLRLMTLSSICAASP